jgi:hypothetical protein
MMPIVRRTRLLIILIAAILAAGAVVFAQDFGRRRYRPMTVQGNTEYDSRLTFVRIRFSGGYRPGSNGEPPWAHDYPTADIHLMKILKELTAASPRIDASNVLGFDDPELFNYPIAYVSEPGMWSASAEEIAGLRAYLKKGGFVIFDDFRDQDWYNLEEQMKRAMPESRWIVIDPAHPVFNSFFEIKNFDFGAYARPTYYGIFEDNNPTKRLMAVAGLDQDLGEYWEFSDTGYVPIDLSNEAYKFGVNYFIYALTH